MWFNRNTFGAYCPDNWREIADYLNDTARVCGVREDDGGELDLDEEYALDVIWERWSAGAYEDAPEPIFS